MENLGLEQSFRPRLDSKESKRCGNWIWRKFKERMGLEMKLNGWWQLGFDVGCRRSTPSELDHSLY